MPIVVGPAGLYISHVRVKHQTKFGIPSLGSTVKPVGIQSAEAFGHPSLKFISDIDLVHPLIPNQFPQFVQEDHENFVQFVQSYYEWMEQNGEAIDIMKHLRQYQDIDTAVDVFAEALKKEFLVNFPSNLLSNQQNLLKNVKDFYRARGTEKAYRLFFRLLFNTEIDFYYPNKDILRSSDGKWTQHRTFKVTAITRNPFDLVGRQIIGSNKNASAFVENVLITQEGSATYYELYLNKSSISGTFAINEILYTNDESERVTVKITPLVSEVKIVKPGKYYRVGDIVTFEHGNPNKQATAKILAVDKYGGIQKIQMITCGAGYEYTPTVILPINSSAAIVEAVLGPLTTYPGFYTGDYGQLSAGKYLHDGYFYQQCSYVVYVNESIDKYRDALKRQLHPAGLLLFGCVRSQNKIRTTAMTVDDSISMVLHDLLPLASVRVNAKTHVKYIRRFELQKGFKLGPSLRSIERDKFNYKPYDYNVYDARNEFPTGNPNSGYWNLTIEGNALGNVPMFHFEDKVIGDFYNNPEEKTNIMPEPMIRKLP